MSNLDGIALVTGAGILAKHPFLRLRRNANSTSASGIGRELALAYARAGCSGISLADLNTAGLQETVELIMREGYNTKTLAIETNTTDLESVRNLVSQTVKAFGRLDYGKISPQILRAYLMGICSNHSCPFSGECCWRKRPGSSSNGGLSSRRI